MSACGHFSDLARRPALVGNAHQSRPPPTPTDLRVQALRVRELALHHRDVDAPDLAFGADLHGLPVAGGCQRQVGCKSRSLDEHVNPSTACRALEIAENVPARFAPVAGNPIALTRDVAAQIEFVAVAGAMEILLQR